MLPVRKDFLDTYPTNAVAATEATATTKNGYAALNGIHRIMYVQYDQQGQAGEGSNNIFRDLMGEDIVYPLANGSTGLIGFMQWMTHRNVNAVRSQVCVPLLLPHHFQCKCFNQWY